MKVEWRKCKLTHSFHMNLPVCVPSLRQKADQRRHRACLERAVPPAFISPLSIVISSEVRDCLPAICMRDTVSRIAGPVSECSSECCPDPISTVVRLAQGTQSLVSSPCAALAGNQISLNCL